MLKYTKDHEWIRVEGEIAVVGITAHAQEQLGDIVFVELPAVGLRMEQGTTAATVESVKAAADVYAPLTGEVVEVNGAIVNEPSLVNSDPTGKGWFFKMKIAEPSQMNGLLDEATYQSLFGQEENRT